MGRGLCNQHASNPWLESRAPCKTEVLTAEHLVQKLSVDPVYDALLAMETFSGNLFALLTLIVAPAVLTNASSVLALNTANRFGRVVDRSRQIVEEMEKTYGDAALNSIRVRQVGRLRRRAGMLIRAQTCFYAALGLFVAAALVSVLGGALASGHSFGYRVAAILGFLVGGGAAATNSPNAA
jgi:hypothetical protein